MTGTVVADEEELRDVVTMVEVGLEGALGGVGEEDDTVFAAFSFHGEFISLQVDLLDEEPGALRDTQACRKQHLENGFVAKTDQRSV